MTLSTFQRVWLGTLIHQLAQSIPDKGKQFDRHFRAVEQGFEAEYPAAMRIVQAGYHYLHAADVEEAVLTTAECREVEAVLRVYYDCQWNAQVTARIDVTAKQLRFPGLDYRTEGRQLAYARFLCAYDDRLIRLNRVEDCRADRPQLDFYRGVLARAAAYRRREGRTVGSARLDIQRILGTDDTPRPRPAGASAA